MCLSEQFIAQTLGIELYLEHGVRGVEIVLYWQIETQPQERIGFPELELLRSTRRTYTNNHMECGGCSLLQCVRTQGGDHPRAIVS